MVSHAGYERLERSAVRRAASSGRSPRKPAARCWIAATFVLVLGQAACGSLAPPRRCSLAGYSGMCVGGHTFTTSDPNGNPFECYIEWGGSPSNCHYVLNRHPSTPVPSYHTEAAGRVVADPAQSLPPPPAGTPIYPTDIAGWVKPKPKSVRGISWDDSAGMFRARDQEGHFHFFAPQPKGPLIVLDRDETAVVLHGTITQAELKTNAAADPDKQVLDFLNVKDIAVLDDRGQFLPGQNVVLKCEPGLCGKLVTIPGGALIMSLGASGQVSYWAGTQPRAESFASISTESLPRLASLLRNAMGQISIVRMTDLAVDVSPDKASFVLKVEGRDAQGKRLLLTVQESAPSP
jgi:hypothetical protein